MGQYDSADFQSGVIRVTTLFKRFPVRFSLKSRKTNDFVSRLDAWSNSCSPFALVLKNCYSK